MLKLGSVYQARIPEIQRTLVEYTKSDGSDMILVLWDNDYYKTSTSSEHADVAYLGAVGNKVQFTIQTEEDGQATKAWPL